MRMKLDALICILITFALFASPSIADPRFYPDDPIWTDIDTEDASAAEPWDINLLYDAVENMFTKPGDKTTDTRALSINTVDEVPDSSWFTNRKNLTPEDVAKGPNTTDGPASGTWTVIAAKNDGVSPGFTIKDSTGKTWFIKPDPPGYPAMATGTEVTTTKLFWALGYNVPENHIARMRYEDLVIGEGTKVKTPAGKRRPMKQDDLESMLRRAHRDADGSYRVHASLRLEGKVLGGIRFYGTRPDDPNDIIPHEHRRELRGYGVFSAWFNHVDSKAINAMDTLVEKDGKSYVRHYLLDFSSTLGSGSIHPREYWEGYEYLYEGPKPIGKDIVSLGFRVEPWRTQPYFESRSIGKMPSENNKWDPEEWRPRFPNAAFVRARADDKFWAARKALAITDDMIRAAVKAGQFNDPESESFLVLALSQRRDAIGRRYLTQINPVVDPVLDASGELSFANAAVDAGFANAPEGYQATWYEFDNASGATNKIGDTMGNTARMKAPAGLPEKEGSYIKVEIGATKGEPAAWLVPVNAYFHRTAGGWKLVGFQRLP